MPFYFLNVSMFNVVMNPAQINYYCNAVLLLLHHINQTLLSV